MAEYAAKMALDSGRKCIFTSPIKALSNQKYRDFQQLFSSDSCGIITGDVQVNPSAPLLIMTTEVLRSMLYRGSSIIKDVSHVVFDECHYLNDPERGVVYEECLVMLGASVVCVFLSATTGNALNFCQWVTSVTQRSVHLIETSKRVVPLRHELYVGGKRVTVMEKEGVFDEKGWKEAYNIIHGKKDGKKKSSDSSSRGGGGGGARGGQRPEWQNAGGKSQWCTLVRKLENEELLPGIVFNFSKKKCDELAGFIRGIGLNSNKEKNAVRLFASQMKSRLSLIDATLPQVLSTIALCEVGVGVHHGGMLPVLREFVEILFSRGLVKVLCATETFAMGVNMPSKCVVFGGLRKNDGISFRNINSAEYTQMSGRAGRRGLDDVGIVIIPNFGRAIIPAEVLRQVFTGTSSKLKSQFRLTYTMILNLLRIEDLNAEDMIRRSFSEFKAQRALGEKNLPELMEKLNLEIQGRDGEWHKRQTSQGESDLEMLRDLDVYIDATCEISRMSLRLSRLVASKGSAASLFSTGRVVVLRSEGVGAIMRKAVVLKSPRKGEESLVVLSDWNGKRSEGGGQDGVKTSASTAATSKAEDIKGKEGTVGFVGQFCDGFTYKILKVEFADIFYATDVSCKIDSKKILKEDEERGGRAAVDDDFFGGMKAVGRMATSSNADSDFFGGMKATGKMATKSDADADFFGGMKAAGKMASKANTDSDFFGGMKAAVGKKGGGTQGDALTLGASSYKQEVEKAVKALRGSSFTALNVVTSCKGVKGDIEVVEAFGLFFDAYSSLRSFTSHTCANLEGEYLDRVLVDKLRKELAKLKKLSSAESLELFPDFKAMKVSTTTERRRSPEGTLRRALISGHSYRRRLY